MNKLYIIGIGPGGAGSMTLDAIDKIKESDAIVAYGPYLDYIKEAIDIEGKETFTSGMTREIERCQKAIDLALEGKTTSILSTGDAGQYGMAGPIYELLIEQGKINKVCVEVIPGVGAIYAAAAEVGAPIMMDLALISLSDLLVPWETIEKRLDKAADADFVIGIYNPRSKTRVKHLPRALEIIGKYRDKETPIALVRNAGRDDTYIELSNLNDFDYEKADMKSLVIVGNSTSMIKEGLMITKRGYNI